MKEAVHAFTFVGFERSPLGETVSSEIQKYFLIRMAQCRQSPTKNLGHWHKCSLSLKPDKLSGPSGSVSSLVK